MSRALVAGPIVVAPLEYSDDNRRLYLLLLPLGLLRDLPHPLPTLQRE